jgi:hypothetical protein
MNRENTHEIERKKEERKSDRNDTFIVHIKTSTKDFIQTKAKKLLDKYLSLKKLKKEKLNLHKHWQQLFDLKILVHRYPSTTRLKSVVPSTGKCIC